MTRTDILNTLTEIFREVFDDAQLNLGENTSATDIDEWDSFEHITLIASIEQKFSIKLDLKEAATMDNVSTMIDIILSKF